MDSRPKPSAPQSWRNQPLSFWLLLACSGLAVLSLASYLLAPHGVELKYGEFIAKLKKGEIKSATVSPARISGELKEIDPRTKLAKRFTTDRLGLKDDASLPA